MNGAPVLEARNLRKSITVDGDRASRVVLDDVSLAVRPGDVVCLIGSAGSGTSMLLRCLDLLEEIDDGVIEFQGREISDPRIHPRDPRRHIGMVFPADNLFPHLTVLDNCVLAAQRVHGVAHKRARARALELLERFGLAEHAGQRPDRLSAGQQQRVALVRALCTEPRLLLLDDITAGLDPEPSGDVLDVLRDLAEAGTTMVLATHELGLAREIASHVVFLDQGRIVEEGPPWRLLNAPREPRTREFLRRVLPD